MRAPTGSPRDRPFPSPFRKQVALWQPQRRRKPDALRQAGEWEEDSKILFPPTASQPVAPATRIRAFAALPAMSAIFTGPPSWHLSSRPTANRFRKVSGADKDVAGFPHRLDNCAGYAVGDDAWLSELLVVFNADNTDRDGIAERILLFNGLGVATSSISLPSRSNTKTRGRLYGPRRISGRPQMCPPCCHRR